LGGAATLPSKIQFVRISGSLADPGGQMKTAVTVSLIICGTSVVAIPPTYDFLRTLVVARLLEHPGISSVMLGGEMGDLYRIGCWVLGAAMIAIGVKASFPTERQYPYIAAARAIFTRH
jgi:hypothetical protein